MGTGAGMFERDRVVASVERVVLRLAAGHRDALFVIGEAGLGKTAVLEHARAACARVGLTVADGCGHPMETGVPFGLARQALDGIGGHDLLTGPPVSATPAGAAGDDRAARLYAVLRWLEERRWAPTRARDAGMVFLFDDIHWADSDSLALAVFLCRRLADAPVGLIATARPWPDGSVEMARGLVHDRLASAYRLAPLSQSAAGAMLADRLGHPVQDGTAGHAYTLTAGNPLLLEQVARSLLSGTSLPAAGDLLLGRFGGLPQAGMRCAQAAAVLGSRFLPPVAAEIAGLDRQETQLAMESLDLCGLISYGPGGDADFVHPLFRQALYDELPGLVRGDLHARAFAALAARGLDAQAAEHAIAASMLGDPAAIAVLSRAGTAARRAGALDTAVRRFEAAVALSGDNPGPQVRLALGESLLASGQPARAAEVYRDLLDDDVTLPSSERVRALWMLGKAFVLTAAHELAVAAFGAAVELAEPDDAANAVAVLLDWAFAIWLIDGPGHALPIAARAAALAVTVGDDARASADAVWGHMALQAGDPAGMAAAESAIAKAWSGQMSDLGTGLGASLHPLSNFGYCAVLTERFSEADQAFARLLAEAEQAGAPEDIGLMSTMRAWVFIRTGRLADALTQMDQALALADLMPMVEGYACAGRAYIQLYRGELADSALWHDRGMAVAKARGQWIALLFLYDAHGVRCLRAGAVAEACAAYDELARLGTAVGIGEPCLPPWGRHAVAAYLSAGRTADAERVIGWLEAAASPLPCRFPGIAVATGRAWLAEIDGNRASAEAQFEHALRLHTAHDMPVELAETLLAFGEFLRRGGQLSRSRAVLRQTAQVATASGAAWLASLAVAELRLAGGRRREPASGLTAAEERVADRVVTGASNPEVARQLHVSVRTVETHLERIYVKLGVRSRHELMAKYRDVPRC